MIGSKPKRKKYRHLFFDLDNTVWDFNRNSRAALRDSFPLFGIDEILFEDFFTVYTQHNNQLWDLYLRNGLTKAELSKARFDLTFEDVGIRGIDGKDFNQVFLEMMVQQTLLCGNAIMVLDRLAAEYNLYIITNGFKEVQYKKLANSGIAPYFKKVFVSEEIGLPKPNPEIFRFALKSCRARKNESIMIGDSWEIDVLGAMNAGIDQVHYAPNMSKSSFSPEEQQIISQQRSQTFRITDLTDLFDFF